MPVTPGTIAVTEGSGKTLDCAQVTVSSTTVLREVIALASPTTPGNYAEVNSSSQLSVSVDNNPVLGAGSNSIGTVIAVGSAASGASKSGNPVQVGAVFNTTQPTVTTGQVVEAQATARGARIVATGVDTFNVTVNAALPAGTNVIGHVIVDTAPSTAVTNAGTFAVQATLSAETTKVIGTVNVAAAQTIAVTQATGTNLHTVVDSGTLTAVTTITNAVTTVGGAASGASKSGNPVQVGGVFNTTQPTVTTGQMVECQATARGAQIVATGVDTFNVTVNAALPAGTNVIGHVIVDTAPSTAVTNVGTFAVQATLSAETTKVIGTVNVAASQTIAVTQATGTNLHTVVDSGTITAVTAITNAVTTVGGAASGASKSGNPIQTGAVFNTTQPTVTTGQIVESQATARGAQIVATGVEAFAISGVAASGSAASGNPILIAGIDGGAAARTLSTDTTGHLFIISVPTTSSFAAYSPKYISTTGPTVLKAGVGNLYGLWLVNLATTTLTTASLVQYIHFFNTTTTTGLTTATWLFALPIPGNPVNVIGTGGGPPLCIPPGAMSLANFTSGIVIVINTTSTSNAAASGTAPNGVVFVA